MSDDLLHLLEAYLEDELAIEDQQALADRLAGDPRAMRQFVRASRMDYLLGDQIKQTAGSLGAARTAMPAETALPQITPAPLRATATSRHYWRRHPVSFWAMVSALTLLLAAGFFLVWSGPFAAIEGEMASDPPQPIRQSVARIIDSFQPVFDKESDIDQPDQQLLPGDRIMLARGTVKLQFGNGVNVLIEGPAEFRVNDSKLGTLTAGRLAALVPRTATGFAVETPSARVVDLGTEFGVQVDRSGVTKVAVFDGTVAMCHVGSTQPRRQLTAGQSAKITADGKISAVRLAAADYPRRLPKAAEDSRQVIASVRTHQGIFYAVERTGLREDALAYVDRDYQWNGVDEQGIPQFLQGAEYVRTANDDKTKLKLQLFVQLAQPATLYLFFDDRHLAPDWLQEQFEDTGADIGLDSSSKGKTPLGVGPGQGVDTIFSIWRCEVREPGQVALGSTDFQTGTGSMYGLAATPLEADLTTPEEQE